MLHVQGGVALQLSATMLAPTNVLLPCMYIITQAGFHACATNAVTPSFIIKQLIFCVDMILYI